MVLVLYYLCFNSCTCFVTFMPVKCATEINFTYFGSLVSPTLPISAQDTLTKEIPNLSQTPDARIKQVIENLSETF